MSIAGLTSTEVNERRDIESRALAKQIREGAPRLAELAREARARLKKARLRLKENA